MDIRLHQTGNRDRITIPGQDGNDRTPEGATAMTTAQEEIQALFGHMLENISDIKAASTSDIREMLTYSCDRIVDWVDALEKDCNDKLETADKAVRDAAGIIDLAIGHHEDAKSFGWSDRDEDAWKLVVDAYCDLTDAIPGGLPIA
jgi:hypothetical protein